VVVLSGSGVSSVHNWKTYRGIDFGIRHAACLWAQVSPAGQLFIVDELLTEDTPTPPLVGLIRERGATWGLVEEARYSRCDPAGKSRNTQTAESGFDVFARRAGVQDLSPDSEAIGQKRPSGSRSWMRTRKSTRSAP